MEVLQIIQELESRGFNKNAAVTQESLYSVIKRSQLFSNTNRLNAGWGRGKIVVATYDETSDIATEAFINSWVDLVHKYQNQFLCIETSPKEWQYYDFNGTEVTYEQIFTPKESLSFENSDYRRYITAIKSKPFLLLAGISGTGKSRIVRELARACWEVGSKEYEDHKPRNFEMVQVKPNWHDSSELIGYVSRVSGKPEYIAGDFLKFVAKAWSEPDVPYFLCLDEMNLAPVEQYFAEYLSVVESRKNKDGIVVTDPLLNAENESNRDSQTGFLIPKKWYENLLNELLAKCPDDKKGSLTIQFIENGICIPPNLIVVGTVNMDETTFSFSRKVLDRAMTIEMNEVNLSGGLDNRHEQIGKLGNAELVGNAVEGVDIYEAHKDVCDKVIEYLQAVNDKLEGTPFKIAYRTRNEFLLYVVNNLPYNKDKKGNELAQDFVIARALDEITNMKILSRIEGDETKVNDLFHHDALKKTVADALHAVCEEYKTEEAVSIKKLDEMKKKLDGGYTSFWS